MPLAAPLLAVLLAQLQPLPPQLVALDSPEGQKLLFESQARAAYFPLAAQFVTQKSTAYCGVASAVMVLNAMPIPAPVAAEWAPFRAFTQDNVFDGPTRAELPPEFVAKGGLTVEQLALLLRGHDVDVQPINADRSSLEQFRQQASGALAQPDHHVLVDFDRSKLGQDMGAHWSPLAAYHAATDRFLMLDVARFRYPPSWIRTEDLFAALNTSDLDSGKQRGYLLISPRTGAPTRLEVPSMRHRFMKLVVSAATALFALGVLLGFLAGRRSRPETNAGLQSGGS